MEHIDYRTENDLNMLSWWASYLMGSIKADRHVTHYACFVWGKRYQDWFDTIYETGLYSDTVIKGCLDGLDMFFEDILDQCE